jgi:preprotein translocase subunit SecG
MSSIFRNILKFISRNIGFLLINLAVILILFSFFINSSINNIDTLKNDLQVSVQEQILVQTNISQNDIEKAQLYCKSNPNDERCKTLSNLNSQLNENQQFNQFFENIRLTKNYLKFAILLSLILFLFGFLFVYLGVFNLLITSYKISVHLAVHNFLAALYFKFLPNLFNLVLSSSKFNQATKGIPPEYLSQISNIILNWIKIPIFVTIKLTIILGIVFLVISLILYFVKKKALKEKNKTK